MYNRYHFIDFRPISFCMLCLICLSISCQNLAPASAHFSERTCTTYIQDHELALDGVYIPQDDAALKHLRHQYKMGQNT